MIKKEEDVDEEQEMAKQAVFKEYCQNQVRLCYYSAEKKKIKMSQKPKGVFTFVSNI